MAGREIVNRQVNIFIQSGEAQKAYDVLINKEKTLNAELDKTSDPKRMAALKDQLSKLAEPIDRAGKKLRGELLPTMRDLETATRKFRNEWVRTGDPASLANFKKANAELQVMKKELNGVTDAQKSLSTGNIFKAAFWANLAANGIAKATAAISGFFRSSVQEALDADEATRRLESTLSNLGRNDAFDRITNKAKELAKQFRFLDNDDIVAVFNKLIDYGKLTEKEMNALLPVIINFAAKSKITIAESASVIIKALEGNGKALKEYGISVKDGGNETERLNIIMTTLKEKVDGAGEAFQRSAAGGFAVARQELNNLKEDIGNKIIPALNNLLTFLLKAGSRIKTFFQAIGDELRGDNGFVTITLGQVDERDPAIKGQIDEIVEQTTTSFLNLAKFFDTKTKAGQEGLKKAQGSRLKALRDSITEDEQRIEELRKSSGRAGLDEVKQLQIGILARRKVLDAIDESLNTDLNKPLGISQPDGPDKDAEKKRKAELKAWEDFLEKIKDLNAEFDASNQEGFEKDLALLQHKIDNLNQEAAKHKDNKAALLLIDELYRKEVLALIDKYALLDKQKIEKASKEQAEILAKGYEKLFLALQKMAELNNRDRLAAAELKVLQSRGREKLKAQLALLNEEEKQELASKKHTGNEILKIQEEFRQKRKKLELDSLVEQINIVIEWGQKALDIAKFFGDAATQRENAELERDRELNNQKQRNLERRLKAGTITQLQYNREVDRMNSDLDRKERKVAKEQFERKKRESIAEALINGAIGATRALADYKWPYNLIVIALTAAMTAAQIATISSQKAPTFAEGGKLGGRSHADGGNAIVDERGRKIAEIEKGEGIVNKKTMADGNQYAASGTPSQIASALNALHGGVNWSSGGRLIPKWANTRPSPFNLPVIQKYYATGGRYSNNTQQQTQQPVDLSMLTDVADSINKLNTILANGISAYTIITQHEKQQTRLDAIRSDATMIK